MRKTNEIGPILDRVAGRIADVPGICGIVLGGSRARGTHSPESDIDIGVYYESDEKLDLRALNEAARDLDDARRDGLVTPPGGWGPWVNAGGWLAIEKRPVDLILRDIARVERAVDDCLSGKISVNYQTGHPHAYLNAMYMGELAVSRVLKDATGAVARLKERTTPYPPKLKAALIRTFSFEAGFSLALAKDNADKDDLYYVSAHLARAASCLNQILFALNEEYCLNEKKAVRMIDGFPVRPMDYKTRLESVFALLGRDVSRACDEMDGLVNEVNGLIGAETLSEHKN